MAKQSQTGIKGVSDAIEKLFDSEAVKAFENALTTFSRTLNASIDLIKNTVANVSKLFTATATKTEGDSAEGKGSALVTSNNNLIDALSIFSAEFQTSSSVFEVALYDLTHVIQSAISVLQKTTPSAYAAKTPVEGMPTAQLAGGGSTGGGASTFAAIAGPAALIAIAFEDMISVVQSAVGETRKWVQALSPATLFQFDYALQNLNATLGVAFVPLFEVLGSLAKEVTGVIYPAMQALAPIVRAIAEIFSNYLSNAIQRAAGLFQLLAPIVDLVVQAFSLVSQAVDLLAIFVNAVLMPPFILLAEFLKPLTTLLDEMRPAIDAVIKVLNTGLLVALKMFGEFLGSIFGGNDMRDGMKLFNDILHEVIKQLTLFGVLLAKTFGAGPEFFNKLIAALQPQAGAPLAVQDVKISGFEDIARNLSIAAVQAGAGGAQKSTEDFLKDISETILEWKDKDTNAIWVDIIKRALKAAFPGINENIDRINTAGRVLSVSGQVAARSARSVAIGPLDALLP